HRRRHQPVAEERHGRARDGRSEGPRDSGMALVRSEFDQRTHRLDADARTNQSASTRAADCGVVFEVRRKKLEVRSTSQFLLLTSYFRLTRRPAALTDLRREAGGHLQVWRRICAPVGEGRYICCGKVFSVPSVSSSSAKLSRTGSAASTRSPSSAGSAPRSATPCGVCCCRRLKARRSPR